METRPSFKENINKLLDVNLDKLTEEELEAYIQSLDKTTEESQEKIKKLDSEIMSSDSKIEHLGSEIEYLDSRIVAGHKKTEELRQERLEVINEMLASVDKQKVKKAFEETFNIAVDIIDRSIENGALQQMKIAAEKKKDSPSSSGSSTPLSKVSSGDELAGDLSGTSLLSRKDSSSDEEKEKTKDYPGSSKSKLSSSATVGSLLPPTPAALPHSSPKADLKKEPSVGERSQVHQVQSATVSKASASPKKEKSLLARLGFNRNKSVPKSQVPVAGSGASATPITQQRNGFN